MAAIEVTLTPGWGENRIKELTVGIVGDFGAESGEVLVSFQKKTIYKEFTPLKNGVSLEDEAGSLPYDEEEKQAGYICLNQLLPKRKTVGRVRVLYTVELRQAGENPVFDLGYEEGGMTGSGMTFMPAFPEGTYDYVLNWDLNGLPGGAKGVWSYGEGRVERKGDEHLLVHTFYGAGLLDGLRLGNFGYYWFSNDEILKNAVVTAQIFRYESEFFQDGGEPYTIFARRTSLAQPRAGGTALNRSYTYIYHPDHMPSMEWMKFLFAHEMVHNWIQIEDEPFGRCTWYREGMAEYYSAVLPWRMGIVTKEELCRELNKRSENYFQNPKQTCTNEEAGGKLMADKEMTRVPYGRGFFYLTYADGQIRRATGGERSLDDVMRALKKRFDSGEKIQNEAWIAEYGRYVGEEKAREEFLSMEQGGEILPDTACFGGEIHGEKIEGRIRGTDEACVLWRFS